MNRRSWQENAEEFAALDDGKGWPFARLVACSVEKASTAHRAHVPIGTRGKTGAREFAEKASTSAARVLRYLAAWEKAAEEGYCPKAHDLEPDDAHKIAEPDIKFEMVYDASNAGGRPRDARIENALTIIERHGVDALTDAMSDEMKAELITALLSGADPQEPTAKKQRASSPADFVDYMIKAVILLHDFAAQYATVGDLDPERLGIVQKATDDLEVSLGWIRSLTTKEAISDAALQTWLDSGHHD